MAVMLAFLPGGSTPQEQGRVDIVLEQTMDMRNEMMTFVYSSKIFVSELVVFIRNDDPLTIVQKTV